MCENMIQVYNIAEEYGRKDYGHPDIGDEYNAIPYQYSASGKVLGICTAYDVWNI